MNERRRQLLLRLKAKTPISGNLCREGGKFVACSGTMTATLGAAAPAPPAKGGKGSGGKGSKGRKGGGGKGGKGGGGKGGGGKAPAKTPEQRAQEQAERDAERAQQRDDERRANEQAVGEQAGLGQNLSDALLEFASPDELMTLAPHNEQALLEKGLIEKGPDGQPRLSDAGRAYVAAAQRGDVRAAADAISRGGSRTQSDRERADRKAALEQRRADAQAKREQRARDAQEKQGKGGKGGGGGGGGKGDAAGDKALLAQQTATRGGLTSQSVSALQRAADGELLSTSDAPNLITLGLLERTPSGSVEISDAGRSALRALERGDTRGVASALQNASQRRLRERARSARQRMKAMRPSRKRLYWSTYHHTKAAGKPMVECRAKARAALHRDTVTRRQRALDAAQRRLEQASTPVVTTKPFASQAQWRWAFGTGQPFARRWAHETPGGRTARYRGLPTKKKASAGLTVFKDHRGHWRWLTRTTTAYKDRDGEIISQASLEGAVALMRETGFYGPLRYWHVGVPFGPGFDLGQCDTSTVIGATLIESGTFADAATAHAVARHAATYELSPGFKHVRGDPDGAGVFHRPIRLFERSLVPTHHGGRASNLFTGIYTEERPMTFSEDELARRVKALQEDTGASNDTIIALLRDIAASQQTAKEHNIAHKDERATLLTRIEADLAALKAMGDAAVVPPPVVKADEEMAAVVAEEPPPPDDAATEEGDDAMMLSPLEIDAIAESVAQKLLAMIDGITTKMGQVSDELKGYGFQRMKAETEQAVATAEQAKQAAAITAQAAAGANAHQTTRIAELTTELTQLKTAHQSMLAKLEAEIAALKGDEPSGPPAHVASTAQDSVFNLAAFAQDALKAAGGDGPQSEIAQFLAFAAGQANTPQPAVKPGLS